jgi:drug/metabolite transporter (DMT)-like permease
MPGAYLFDTISAMAPYLVIAALIQLLWGFTPSASKIVLQHLPVEAYSAIRYSVSGLVFLAYTLARHRRLAVRRRDLPKIALIGVLAYGVDSLGTLYGLKVGGVLNFALASSLNALVTATVAVIVLKEKVARGFPLAAGLSVAGGLVLFAGKYDVSGFEVAGLSLALIWGAYVLEALGFVFSKPFRARMPLTEYLAIAQLAAAVFMWILCAGTGRSPAAVLTMPGEALGSLVFVCLVSCCLCYFVLYWLLGHVEGHKLAFFDCFHTLAAAVIGVLLFDEPSSGAMIAGGALLLAAVVVINQRSRAVRKTVDS